jgi:hypothetical protein
MPPPLPDELVPVVIPQKKGDPKVFDTDEHPRPDTTLEMLAKLKGVNGPDLSVTAGNASGVNDGACALLLASEAAAGRYGLQPLARVVGMATAGVPPRILGFGPAPRAKVAGPDRLTLDRIGRQRTDEALCGAMAGSPARSRLADDVRASIPRRRHRHGPSAVRCGARWGPPAATNQAPWRPLSLVHSVSVSARVCHGDRACLIIRRRA